jgi:magnesium-transporting ATPase (P-type)
MGTIIHKSEGDNKYYGLTDLQSSEKLQQWGKNALSEKKPLPCIVRFLLTMTGLFNYVLIIGSILCYIVYGIQTDFTDKSNLYLAIVLDVVILITAIFTFT